MIKAMAGKSTVLVSSHNLAEIEDLCDEALILDKGKLAHPGIDIRIDRSKSANINPAWNSWLY